MTQTGGLSYLDDPEDDDDGEAWGPSEVAFPSGKSPTDLDDLVLAAGTLARSDHLSSLSAFQRNADRFPPLDPDQQLAAAQQYREAVTARVTLETTTVRGRKRQQLELVASREHTLMEHLCASCWRLAWLIVREQADERFGRDRSAELLPDLMAEANLALVQAVREFDPARTPKFATYAARVVRDHTRVVLSRDGYMRMAPSWNRVKRIVSVRMPELVHELGRNPTTEELQADLLERCMEWAERKLTDEQRTLPEAQKRQLCLTKLRKQGMLGAIRDVEDVMQAAQTVTSLDQRVGDSDGSATVGDLVAQPDQGSLLDSVEMTDLRQALLTALRTLPEREQEIVLLRYGFDGSEGWTYAAIAERFNVTSERIRQIEKAALSRLATPHGQFAALGDFLMN